MAVINIPPNNQIYAIGRIQSTLHVYNPGVLTHYSITIIDVNVWINQHIAQGHTDTYHPVGNAVYVQNAGPSMLQVLHADTQLAPEQAGALVVAKMPAASSAATKA